MIIEECGRKRPQRPVDAFPQLSVAADWTEGRAPRSGSAFYLPLMWTALVFDEADGDPVASVSDGNPALRQLATLGNDAHFHKGRARRASADDLRAAQAYWQQVFSGWRDWVRRLRAAMEAFA